MKVVTVTVWSVEDWRALEKGGTVEIPIANGTLPEPFPVNKRLYRIVRTVGV